MFWPTINQTFAICLRPLKTITRQTNFWYFCLRPLKTITRQTNFCYFCLRPLQTITRQTNCCYCLNIKTNPFKIRCIDNKLCSFRCLKKGFRALSIGVNTYTHFSKTTLLNNNIEVLYIAHISTKQCTQGAE